SSRRSQDFDLLLLLRRQRRQGETVQLGELQLVDDFHHVLVLHGPIDLHQDYKLGILLSFRGENPLERVELRLLVRILGERPERPDVALDLSVGAITRSVNTFDSAISTFALGSGGRLISSACGLRNTVVHMKKMRRRKATSTIGVMSILTPIRFGARFLSPPFLCFTPASGVSTAPIEHHSFVGRGVSPLLHRRLLA